MKSMLIEISSILGKTILVTLAVPLGFLVGGLLGLPSWAQAFGFLPAAWLFCRLSGETVPPVRRWLPFLLGLTFLTFIFHSVFPHIPEFHRDIAFVLFVMFAPSLVRLIPSPAKEPQQKRPAS